MLKYQGSCDSTWGGLAKVNIRIYGDGFSKEIFIPLGKPPFDVAFKGVFPKNLLVSHIAHGAPKTVTMQNDTLNVLFDIPPSAADLTKPDPPFTSFSVEFVYGSDITT